MAKKRRIDGKSHNGLVKLTYEVTVEEELCDMIPLEGEGTAGMGRVKGRARGVDGRELECGCEQRSKEHVREEHGAGERCARGGQVEG